MNDHMELKAVMTAEDRASPVIERYMAKLKSLEERVKGLNAALFGKGGDAMRSGNDKIRDTLGKAMGTQAGLQAKLNRQREDGTKAERQGLRFLETDAVRLAKTRMRETARQVAATVRGERDKQRAAAQAESAAAKLRKAAESDAVKQFRASMRLTRQRIAETKAGERDRQRAEEAAARAHDVALRKRIAGDRWRFQLRDRMDRKERSDKERDRIETIGKGREAYAHGRDAYHRLTRPPAAVALAGTAGAAGMARKVLGAERDIDAAEINSRAYGGLNKEQARELRDKWASPLAEELGAEPGRLITAWVDATKLGIPAAGAKDFAELSTKTSEAWQVPFESVTDILGTVNTLLTSRGDPFSADRLKSVANTMQHLAAKQSTTPEKLISFLQRGAGGADVMGMSQEAGLAFGSASTSLGNQAGQSGRLLDYIAGRVIEMPRIARQKGDQGTQAREMLKNLGYASADDMDRKRRADPDAFLPDLMERFSKINDTKKQDQAIRFFTGREWLGEFGRMVKGAETYREAARLAKEAKGLDAIGEVWNLHKLKLAFVFKQFKSGWLNILGEAGKVLSPVAREFGDFWLGWTAKLRDGGLSARIKAALDGFVEGLGFKDVRAMLEGIFGKPGEGNAGSLKAWGDAARGFAQGLRDVGETITKVFRMFSGGTDDPEKLGRLTAHILGFGLALVVVAPFVSVLGAIGSALLGLGLAAATTWRILKGLGLVGGAAAGGAGAAGAAGGGAGTAGAAIAGGGLLARLSGLLRLSAPAAMPGTAGLSKGEQDRLSLKLGKWAKGQQLQSAGESAPAPTAKAPTGPDLDPLREALKSLDPDLAKRLFPEADKAKPEAPVKLHRQSYGEGDDLRDLVRPAVIGSDEALTATSAILHNERTWLEAGRVVAEGFMSRLRKWNGTAQHEAATVREDDVMERLGRNVVTMGERIERVVRGTTGGNTILGEGGGGTAYAPSPATPAGVPNDSAKHFGKRFFTPPGMTVPDWYGKGRSGLPDPSTGAGAGPYKTALDYIARAEGTAHSSGGGYDTSLGYGKFLPGGHEQKLTDKSLNDILQLGRYMRAQPGNPNSSALGRYQIVGQTLRRLMKKLGLDGSEKFDAAMQDRLGAELVRERGANAHGLGQEWASLKGRKGQEAAGIVGQIPRGASTLPGPRETATGDNVAGGVHPLDGAGRITSAFGMRRHPLSGLTKFHAGLDLAAPAGTIVKAMREGVASIDRSGDVKVAHEDGSSTTYRHIQAGIEAGARVAAGQAIGRLRAHDPRSTGPHLHLETRDPKGALFDPKPLLGRAPVSAPASASKSDGEGFKTTGWKEGAGSVYGPDGKLNETVANALRWQGQDAAPSQTATDSVQGSGQSRAEQMIRNVPRPEERAATQIHVAAASGSVGGPRGDVHIHQQINGAGQNPQELANSVQRHVTEAWNHRAHDLEPELA